jgi:DNA-binding MarR family transcriptional regulator
MKPIPESPSLLLEEFLPYRLSVLSNLISGSIARLYAARFDLTIAEWRVMAVLGRFGPQTAVEITGRTAMDKVRVSRAVARLTSMGRVMRDDDPTDRRRKPIRLTEAGSTIHQAIIPMALEVEARLIAHLEKADLEALNRVIRALSSAIEAR